MLIPRLVRLWWCSIAHKYYFFTYVFKLRDVASFTPSNRFWVAPLLRFINPFFAPWLLYPNQIYTYTPRNEVTAYQTHYFVPDLLTRLLARQSLHPLRLPRFYACWESCATEYTRMSSKASPLTLPGGQLGRLMFFLKSFGFGGHTKLQYFLVVSTVTCFDSKSTAT